MVISSHWKCQGEKIFVNNVDYPEIIYEGAPRKDQSPIEHRVADCKYSFEGLGFPERFLEFKFPYIGSKAIAELVISKLRSEGIEAEGREQGLDHGV